MIQSCFFKTGFWLPLCIFAGLTASLSAQTFSNPDNYPYISRPFKVEGGITGTLTPPFAALKLVGPDTLCAGLRDTLCINFSAGMPPYIFYYSINGIPQGPDTTSANPYVFLTPPLTAGAKIVVLDSLWADGIAGAVSGTDTITVLPAPTASLQSDTVALCVGQTDSLHFQFTGPGPYTFQYAANFDTIAPIITSDTSYSILITPPLGNTIYRLVGVSGGSCDGPVSGIYNVTVSDPPTALLQGDTSICPGDSANLVISYTGMPPFVVTYTADGIPQKPDTSFLNPRILVVTPGAPTLYELTGVHGVCSGMFSGQANVDILPAPTATISGGGQICQGGSGTTITVSFTGPGPYTFVYRAGLDTLPPVTTNSNPYVINVNPANGTFYRLVSVSNGTCTGTVSGTAVVAVFTPSTAEILGDLTLCESADTVVTVDFTGSGPFTLVYTANGVPQDTVDTFEDPYFIPVNITTTTVYELVSVESPGCFGSVQGLATVTINYPPSFDSLNIICDLVAGTYTVEFDAVDAALPLTLINGSGTFTGAHFTSDPIPVALDYDFSFHDDHDCGDIVVSGTTTCSCSSDAGTMDLTPITSCTGMTATALHNGNHNLDNNDTLLFILHTNPGSPTGQIIAWNTAPSFAFGPGIQPNVTYYISAIAGNPNMAGNIDLMDPCLSIATGTPVVWRLSPTATMDANFDICPGEQVFIPVTFTGQAPFTLTYTKNGQQTIVLALQNTFSISATLLDTAIYQAIAVGNAQCPGTASGQALVIVHPAPQIVNVNAVCAPDNLTYTLDFDVVNSDLSTAVVSGSVTGNYDPVTGHFTSNPIQAQTLYTATVTDSWQCGLDSISGDANCACVTSAGIMDQTPLVLCNTDTAFAVPASGVFLAPGDSLLYVLVTTNSPMSWNILGFSPTPEFVFDPGSMVAGTSYFIAAIAGNSAPGGIDLNDPCFNYTIGPSVVWQSVGTVILGADTQICQGDTSTLQVLFAGNAPYNFTYQINGVDQSSLSTSNASYLLAVSPSATSTYSLVAATANGCPTNFSGSAVVTVNELPQILMPTTVCDLNTLQYTLEFNISNGAAPNPIYTINGLQGTLTDSTFQSVPLGSGQAYNVTVFTPSGCTATLSGSATCMCVTEAGMFSSTAVQNICMPGNANLQVVSGANLGPGDTLQYILYQNPAALPAGIIASNTLPQFGFQPGMVIGTTYYISSMAGNVLPNGSIDLTDPCLSFSPGVPIVFRQPPTASISGDTTICVGNNTIFKINFTGKSPFQFVYSINGVQQTAVSAPQNSFTVSTNNVQQTQVFALVSVQDAYCIGTASGTVTVNIQNGPTAALASNTSICPGDSALLTLQLSGATNFDVTVNGGPTPIQLIGVQNGSTFTVSPANTTTYSIGSFNAQGNSCPSTIGTTATVTVAPALSAVATISNFGGVNISCPNENDGSISLNISGGLAPVNSSWSNGSNGPGIQNLTAGTYTVTITDNLGCMYQDSFVLNAPEELMVDLLLQNPVCFGDRNGMLTIQNIQGGLGPFSISSNGLPVQITDVFPVVVPGLAAGSYTLSVEDINGCATVLDTVLTYPPLLSVDLGPDVELYPGDSTLLQPVLTGVPLDSFSWTPSAGISRPDLLNGYAQPTQTTIYTLWVQDTAGCRATDAIQVVVRKDYRLYVPNVIMPGAPVPNGILTVYAGQEVVNIRVFRVYDRWGANVFEGLDITPNNPAMGWDGSWQGNLVQPGVYAWVAELEFLDGTTEIRSGDVTILR